MHCVKRLRQKSHRSMGPTQVTRLGKSAAVLSTGASKYDYSPDRRSDLSALNRITAAFTSPSQHATPVVSQRHTLLPELSKQRFDLVALERNDPLLAFVEPSAEDGEQNVPKIENDVHWTLGRGEENRPASEARWLKSSGWD